MGNKIFLDVGAYIGDTSSVVVDKKYKFDIIHCFEPSKSNCNRIKKNKRIAIHEFGLFNKTCNLPLYCDGSNGASVFKEKKQPLRNQFPSTKVCKFVKASDWFVKNISLNDNVVMKINAEGAEIEILNDLMDTGEYKKIDHLFIMFDVGKIKGKEHLEAEVLHRLKELGVDSIFTLKEANILAAKGIAKKNQRGRIEYWLKTIGDTDEAFSIS